MRTSLLALMGHAAAALGLVIEPGSLRTQGVEKPLGIHYTEPMLSWRLLSDKRGDLQTAYQVQAASSISGLEDAEAWDTGKVTSGQTFADWDGETLGSRSQVFWRVRAWDSEDEVSEWSEASSFELGLLDHDQWEAEWITNQVYRTGVNSLPMFAKGFDVDCEVEKARLYVTGLGTFRAEINGETVSDEVMGPGYSTINRTVLYRAYDVTDKLQQGDNVIGVALGKGIYNSDRAMWRRYRKFQINLRDPLIKSQLEITCQDGSKQTVISDDSWSTTADGPLLEASWYGGEEFDARKIIPGWSSTAGDRSNWMKANISEAGPVPGPRGELYSQTSPQLKITETFPAKTVNKVGDQYVFDFGVNYAGWFSFTMNGTGKAGERIVFYSAEILNDVGAPDQKTTGRPIFDGYTLAGEESETFTLQFMYHGHQFIGVNTTWEPKVDDMTGHVIRAANEKVSSVSTSNTLLNTIHEIIDRAIKGNMYTVLTDCPHREKLGWLEQDHLVFEPLARGYDIQAYGADFMRTMSDAQAQWGPEGLIPNTAPEYEVFAGGWEMYRADPNWGNNIMRFPMQLYQYYGDKKVLRDWYPVMVQFMDYLGGRSNGTDLRIIDDGIGLRDWAANDKTVSIGFTNTFAYQQAAAAMKQIAQWLGLCSDAKKWKLLEDDIRAAQHETYFSREGGQGHYDVNNQATNALALDMGAVPEEYVEEVFQSMLDELERFDWVFSLGEIGLPSLLRMLQKYGREDAIFRLMTQTKASSYGYQIENGATSLWEHWNGTNEGGWGSLNHFMMGVGDYWLHRLSGLAPREKSVRWNAIDYAPIVVGDLTFASADYCTPGGVASANWKLDDDVLTYDIVVPVGSRGYVTLKSSDVREEGASLKKGERGVANVTKGDGTTLIEVGSGKYQFTAKL